MDDTERLHAIRLALFPDPEPVPGNPSHTVTLDALENLAAVIATIHGKGFDDACLRTLQTVVGQMTVARRFAKIAE